MPTVMQKREINPQTRFDVPPKIDEELLCISNDCLMVQNDKIRVALRAAFKSVFFFFVAFPLSLHYGTKLWLPPYGHNGDSATFFDMLHRMAVSNLITNLILSIIVIITLIYLASIQIKISFVLLKSYSPITFNREEQIVSYISNKKEVTIRWLDVEGVQHLSSSTVNVNDYDIIELDKFCQIRGDEGLWEYICIFMQEGPENLSIMPYTRNAWDHEPLYSRTFSQAKHHLRIWPINTNPSIHPFASYVLWPYKVVRYMPFLLVEWFWRRLILLRKNKESINFPEQRYDGCKGECVTGKMAAKVIQDNGDMDGIDYLTLKQRLKGSPYM